MIYVFYSNDPLANDQGGGAEHFRCIKRALDKSGMNYRLVAARVGLNEDARVDYISNTPNFLRYFIALWAWFYRNRGNISGEDVFHFHRNYAAWPKYVLCPGKGRVAITYHNTTGKVAEAKLGMFFKPVRVIMKMLERRAVSLADRIIFVSDRDRQALKEEILRNSYSKTDVIPAAFNSNLFLSSSPPPNDLADKILVIGRMAYQKNMPLAIDVYNKLRSDGHDYSMTIAGDGEDYEEVKRYASAGRFSEGITCVGRVEHNDIPKLMESHGIVLVTSRYEASPTIVKEAIAAERPVVTTDVGDVNIWITSESYGFICDHDENDLSEAIIKASGLVREGQYDRKINLAEFSEDAIMKRLLSTYQALETAGH